MNIPQLRSFARRMLPCLVYTSLLSVLGRTAMARPEFLPVAKSAYAIKPGGVIDSAGCRLCHAASGPPQLNPYGASIKELLNQQHARTPTASMLHALDGQDPDGDGFTNAEEFAADTLPGDPTSHPAGKPQARTQAAAGAAQPGAETSPFNLLAALRARHAQHPILVHFPIALFSISLLLDLLALWKRSPMLAQAAGVNLVVAALSALPAVASGLIAWQWQLGGGPLEGTLRLHLIFAVLASGMFWLLWWVRASRRRRIGDLVTAGYLALAFVTLAALAIAGHLGGFLSGTAL